MTLALKFHEVSKSYGKQNVLDAISLEIRGGSIVGLIGENGAGKTTLIKCMLDFCELQSGNIEIFGVDHQQTKSRSRLAFLPESFTPPYFVTGTNFLKHMAKMNQIKFDPDILEKVILAVDLDPSALNKPVRTLSKGMAQKLGLAAVLMSNKDLLVLDEPMSGLDPKARALLKRRLAAIKKEGKSLFFSTHLLADVEELCDQVAILHNGKLQFLGNTQECCEYYEAATLEEAYISSIS
ncbi:MAG: ABC transporter ATP-binding protein [Gammaproteobacteria bacterium]